MLLLADMYWRNESDTIKQILILIPQTRKRTSIPYVGLALITNIAVPVYPKASRLYLFPH